MSDPEILKTARANLQWTVDAWESAGGRVDLTATTLTFRPHLFNASLREPVVIDLRAIISVTPVRQRVLGSIPSPIQNALLIRGADDSFAHVLIVWKRDSWIAAIDTARDALALGA